MCKVLKERRLLYCWQGEAGQYEIGSEAWAEVKARGDGLCMLLAGHAGPHVFTPDSEIAVVFGEAGKLTCDEVQERFLQQVRVSVQYWQHLPEVSDWKDWRSASWRFSTV